VPITGYGADGPDGWVRVLARVLLTPPGKPRDAAADARGWRLFLTHSAAGVPVTVQVGSATHTVPSDLDGYVDLRLPADLAPGWATASFVVGDREPVEAAVRVVGPDTRLGLVSDIDDTVIVTMLPRPLLAFRNAFLVRERERHAVPGMAALYREVVEAHPDVFVVYLSTGAWNTARPLARFLARHGYPRGPLLLTDWGPTTDGWFRSGPEHKRRQLARLFDELPRLRWLLVGDDGQHDPSLYAEAAREHPGRVLGVAIRQLSAAEQVAGHGSPTPRDEAAPNGAGGPLSVAGPDGAALAQELRARGVLP
jgi:phosphatidate phosphatase APP1